MITERKGKPSAKIVPLNSLEKTSQKLLTPIQIQLLAEMNSLPRFEIGKEPTDILRDIRKTKAAKARAQYEK